MVKDGSAHVFVLLDEALRALRGALVNADLGAVPDGVRREIETLRSSQLRLLSLTPVAGIRGSELAEQVGMTKQALSEFAQVLVGRGLLDAVPDPADGRARLLRPTALGSAVAQHTREVVEGIERAWRDDVGPEVWDAMRAGLRAVGERAGSASPPG